MSVCSDYLSEGRKEGGKAREGKEGKERKGRKGRRKEGREGRKEGREGRKEGRKEEREGKERKERHNLADKSNALTVSFVTFGDDYFEIVT